MQIRTGATRFKYLYVNTRTEREQNRSVKSILASSTMLSTIASRVETLERSSSRLQVAEAAQRFLQVRYRAVVVDEPHEPELVAVHRHQLDELLRGLQLVG